MSILLDANLKSLIELYEVVLSEEGTRCCTNTIRDLEYVTDRTESEGLSFLTITLPAFGKDFERSLEQGQVSRNLFAGFQRKGCLPRFLSGFTGLIFCAKTGELVDRPDIDAIRAVRQLTLMFGKIKLPCSDERVAAAMKGYIDCEQSVREYSDDLSRHDFVAYDRLSTLLWAEALSTMDGNVYDGRLLPQHGPGSTADRLLGNQKYTLREWTVRLESYFPAGEFLFTNPRDYHEGMHQVNWLEPGTERPVKVISVPKTPSAPRIIAIEPTCGMFAQKALQTMFYEVIEGHNSLSSFVGFTDQGPNRDLARKGSIDGSLATLDLSEASDRVGVLHVEHLLRNHPHLRGAVFACRSTKAAVPGYGIVPLAKFASMGSALTFPLEAMVFATVIFVGIEESLGHPLTRHDIESFRGSVRVYGDDIVVPVAHVQAVIACLERFGFKVNARKSFWRSSFRESCGKEYFAGHDVSIIRVRHLLPRSRRNVTDLVGAVDFRNQAYKSGLWSTAKHLDAVLRRMISFPTVSDTSPVLGRHSFLGYETGRLNPRTQSPEVKGWTVRPVLPENGIDGYDALLKVLLQGVPSGSGFVPLSSELLERPSEAAVHWSAFLDGGALDEEHLRRSGRPVCVDIKHGWAPSY